MYAKQVGNVSLYHVISSSFKIKVRETVRLISFTAPCVRQLVENEERKIPLDLWNIGVIPITLEKYFLSHFL